MNESVSESQGDSSDVFNRSGQANCWKANLKSQTEFVLDLMQPCDPETDLSSLDVFIDLNAILVSTATFTFIFIVRNEKK